MSEQTWRWGPPPPDDGITVEELGPHGWAPGKYVCFACPKCGEGHGDCDKRSRSCRPCAVASLKTAQAIAGHRAHWSFYGIPRMAQTVFRLRAMEARCDEPDAVSAFAAAGVTEFLRTVVETFDAVMAHLAAMPAEARPGIEIPLFGEALTPRPGGARRSMDVRVRRITVNEDQSWTMEFDPVEGGAQSGGPA